MTFGFLLSQRGSSGRMRSFIILSFCMCMGVAVVERFLEEVVVHAEDEILGVVCYSDVLGIYGNNWRRDCSEEG